MSKDDKVTDKQVRKENAEVLSAEESGDVEETFESEPEVIEAAPEAEPESKRFQDDARQAIYGKAPQVRDAQKDADFEQMDDHGRVMGIKMEMEAAGQSDEAITLELHKQGYLEIEDAELEELKAQVPDEKSSNLDRGQSNSTVDTKSDTVRIRVNGEDHDIPSQDVVKAGVATLQKERNADIRQQELSAYERSLRDYETKIRENAERGLDTNGNPLVSPSKEGLPDKGAINPEDVKRRAKAVREAAFNGDDEGFEESLTDLVTSVAQGRSPLTPPLDDEKLVEAVANKLNARSQQKQYRETAVTVNSTFRDDYSDLHDDDQKFRLTKTEFDRLRETEPNSDPVILMRKAGDSIRGLFGEPSNTLESDLEQRRNAKHSSPTSSRSAAKRRPAPKSEPKPLKRSDIVAGMRHQRGL